VQTNVASSLPSATAPIVGQQTTEKFGSNIIRVEISQFERQQAELEQREKRLAERERELRNAQIGSKFCFFFDFMNHNNSRSWK
jgi:hypothetical protein